MNRQTANRISSGALQAAQMTLAAVLVMASTSTLANKLDCIEDGAEDIGAAVERQWERLEDGLFGESEEERREEARERAEDRQEELEEARQGKACK